MAPFDVAENALKFTKSIILIKLGRNCVTVSLLRSLLINIGKDYDKEFTFQRSCDMQIQNGAL